MTSCRPQHEPAPYALRAACQVSAALAMLRESDPDQWLGAGCGHFDRLPLTGCAAHAVVCERAANADKWRIAHAGQAPTSHSGHHVRSPAITHWTHGASNIRIATDDRDQPIHTCQPRWTIIDDDAWNDSPLRRRRQDHGLFDFARATAPISPGVALVVHLDGLTPQWRTSPTELALLSGVTAAMADAFADRFIAHTLRRQVLLDDLTAMQRVLAPLLASGLSERAIGRRVDRSAHTIHEHAKRIYERWNVPNRYALRDKWLGADMLPGYELPQRSLATPTPVA